MTNILKLDFIKKYWEMNEEFENIRNQNIAFLLNVIIVCSFGLILWSKLHFFNTKIFPITKTLIILETF